MRTAPAAYWASWADCLFPLSQRYPRLGAVLLAYSKGLPDSAPASMATAQAAASQLDTAGFAQPPGWRALAAGEHPRQREAEEAEPGDKQQGRQFHASSALEQQEHANLLSVL